MTQKLDHLKETPSQTAGPYVHIGLTPNFCGISGVYPEDLGVRMLDDRANGERITVSGRIFDGSGALVRDALVEIWQADAAGLYKSPVELRGTADPHFSGWGRCPISAEDGRYRFETVRPGHVPFKDGRRMAPHISFWIVARGINIGLHTRMYFPDEAQANASDPVLSCIENSARIATLVAQGRAPNFEFDIHLQGERETVFLDI